MVAGRPNIKIELTPSDWLLEIFTLAAVFFGAVIVAVNYRGLPATVPTHFGVSGQPDGWGPKTTMWLLPAISLGQCLLLTVIGRFPQIYNYPVEITETNAERLYRIATGCMRWLKFELSLLTAYTSWAIINMVQGKPQMLGMAFPAFMILIIGTAVVFVIQIVRAR